MKIKFLATLALSGLIVSCNDTKEQKVQEEVTKEVKTNKNSQIEKQAIKPTFQNKAHELVYNMVEKAGNYERLLQHKDVVYTYTYKTPDGKADISTEKYIFDGELSYGAYKQHQRTFPDLEGIIEQGYDGKEYWLKHKGEIVVDTNRLKRVAFNRPTNFYWFAMLPKLLDPGLQYEYVGEENINDKQYDVVKVTFDLPKDKPKDIYQVYINKETLLMDQFLFTVADFGIMDTPNLMKVTYEEVDDIWIPSKRQYKRSNWNAEVTEKPWVHVTWSDIKFNNNLSEVDFKR